MTSLADPLSLPHGPAWRNRFALAPLTNTQSHADGRLSEDEHRWLEARGLVTEESSWYQYRFQDVVDPETDRVLFTLEHEVRSLRSPLYLRPLVNRNPAQRQPTYQRGRDAFVPGTS